jgi:hypothetical protein
MHRELMRVLREAGRQAAEQSPYPHTGEPK